VPIEAGGITIPDRDYTFAFVRAGGPGGQNVNKVATAAQLRFDLAGTLARPAAHRRRRGADHRAQPPHPGRQSP
jgi:ribosome-associated protein